MGSFASGELGQETADSDGREQVHLILQRRTPTSPVQSARQQIGGDVPARSPDRALRSQYPGDPRTTEDDSSYHAMTSPSSNYAHSPRYMVDLNGERSRISLRPYEETRGPWAREGRRPKTEPSPGEASGTLGLPAGRTEALP